MSSAIVPLRFSARALFAVRSRKAEGRASSSVLRNAGFAALVAVAYYAGTRLGFALTPSGHAISVFWPPNAILLAGLLLAPERLWWALLLAVLPAHLLADLANGIPVSTALGWFLSNTAEALIGAACISRFAGRKSLFETVHGLLVFLLFGVLLAPLLTSLMDAAVVVTTGLGEGYWRLAATRLFSNMLAQLALVPVIVIFVQGGRFRLWQAGWKRQLEACSLAAGIILSGVLVFGAERGSPGNISALVYVPLPLLLWASLRFGLGGLSASLLGTALISTWNGMHGRGPFDSPSMTENVLSLKVLLCMVTVPLMLLAAVIADRRRTEESLRDTSGKLINAQEQERSRLAAEIHDDFSQRLALLALGLEIAEETIVTAPDKAVQELQNLRDSATEIGTDLHTLSHRLHSSTLAALGLVLGVGALCREFASQQGIEIDFLSDNIPRSVHPDVALCLFRIVQEGLRNSKKHSGAPKAQVRLRRVGDRLLVSVSDEGVGFDVRQLAEKEGLGIRSMEERAHLLGGRCEIRSEFGKGTRIEAWVPLQPKSELAAG